MVIAYAEMFAAYANMVFVYTISKYCANTLGQIIKVEFTLGAVSQFLVYVILSLNSNVISIMLIAYCNPHPINVI